MKLIWQNAAAVKYSETLQTYAVKIQRTETTLCSQGIDIYLYIRNIGYILRHFQFYVKNTEVLKFWLFKDWKFNFLKIIRVQNSEVNNV
jgi:hypothetical protein